MSRKKKKKRSRKTRKIILCSVLGQQLLLFCFSGDCFIFGKWKWWEIPAIPAEEVEDMVISGFLDHNSVWLSVFRRQINLEDVPFIRSARL